MRKYVFDFSLTEPVAPTVTVATFPHELVDRLFSKKTHYLDWMRFLWIGILVTLARKGQLDATGRYRLMISYTGFNKYECQLYRSI